MKFFFVENEIPRRRSGKHTDALKNSEFSRNKTLATQHSSAGLREDAKFIEPIVVRETSTDGGFKYRINETISPDIEYT